MLRDWTSSEAVDSLTAEAEVMFTRLIMKADDYGSFHSNPKLIKAALFPLKEYSAKAVDGWLDECVRAGLVIRYRAEDKDFIRIENFGQRLQNMRSAFPQPYGDSPEVTVTPRKSPPEEKRREEEEKKNMKKKQVEPLALPFDSLEFQNAWVEWEQHRREKKIKITPLSLKKQITLLGGRPELEAIEMLQTAIRNGWTGIFEPKNNGKGINSSTGAGLASLYKNRLSGDSKGAGG